MENEFLLNDGIPYAVRCSDGHVCIDKTDAIGRVFCMTGNLPVAVATPEYMKYLHRMSFNPDLNKKLSQNIEAVSHSGNSCNAILLVSNGSAATEVRTTETPIYVHVVDELNLSNELVLAFPRRVL